MNNNQALWQQYVDVFIGNKCNAAIIFNKADGTPWAATPGFELKQYKGVETKEDGSEVPADIDEEEGFLEYAKTKQKPRHGFRVNEMKYQLLRTTEDGTAILKCKGGGAALFVTERAVVLGTWLEKENQTGPACNQIIEKVGKHLLEHKF